MAGIAIDAYEGTGAVNWSMASRAGLVMGIAKISEYAPDARIGDNWPQIAASGAVRGGYVYLHPSLPAAPQVARALATIAAHGGFGPSDVLAWDIEVAEGRSPGQVLAFLTQCVSIARTVHPYLEQWIYSDQAFLEWLGIRAGQASVFGCRLWVADYGALPVLGWFAHQYTSSGTFPGLPGKGDLSQLRVETREALRALTTHTPTASAPAKPAAPPLPPAAYGWLKNVFIPAHYRGQMIAAAWRRLTSHPADARALVARVDPKLLKGSK